MPDTPSSSFIPKHPLTVAPTRRAHVPIGIFTLVAVIIFLASVIALGGAYAYKLVLLQMINRPCSSEGEGCGLIAALERVRERVREERVQEIETFARKIRGAGTLLDGHRSVVPLFRALGESTLKSVRFTSFELDDARLVVKGEAPTYESVARQAEALAAASDAFESFTVSDLAVVEGERAPRKVSFTVTLALRQSLLRYPLPQAANVGAAADAAGTSTATTPSNGALTPSDGATTTP